MNGLNSGVDCLPEMRISWIIFASGFVSSSALPDKTSRMYRYLYPHLRPGYVLLA